MNERIIETSDLGTDEQILLSIDAAGELYVADEPVQTISAIGGGIVALATLSRTAHVGAADYWRILHGDIPPSQHEAGYLAAQLAHARSHARELIELLEHEELLDNAFYLSLADIVTALQTALGEGAATQAIEA